MPDSFDDRTATSVNSTTSKATASSSWRWCSCRSWWTIALLPPTRQSRPSGRRRSTSRGDFARECWSMQGESCFRCCCEARRTGDLCCKNCRCSTNRLIRLQIGSLRRQFVARFCWPRRDQWWRVGGLPRRHFDRPRRMRRNWGRYRNRGFACPICRRRPLAGRRSSTCKTLRLTSNSNSVWHCPPTNLGKHYFRKAAFNTVTDSCIST